MTPIESIPDHQLAQVSGGKSDKFAQYAGLATNLLGMFTGSSSSSSGGGLMSLFKGLGGLGKKSKGSGQSTSQDTSQGTSTGSSDSDSSSDSSTGASSEAADDGG